MGPKLFGRKPHCQEKNCPLGIFVIVPKQSENSSKLSKPQKYILGHGKKTSDPIKAGEIFLSRDHKKIVKLLLQYVHGKLGVYMVPPMFFGEVPEAVKLSEYTKGELIKKNNAKRQQEQY